MDAQKAQIRTASLVIGIEPKSAPNGGSVRAAVQPIGNGLQQSCLTGLM
jgi:hypothetical protein